MGFPGGSLVKHLSAMQETIYNSLIPGSERPPWRRKWQPIPVFLPGKSLGQRSLAGFIIHGGSQELDTLKQLNTTTTHMHILSKLQHK